MKKKYSFDQLDERRIHLATKYGASDTSIVIGVPVREIVRAYELVLKDLEANFNQV